MKAGTILRYTSNLTFKQDMILVALHTTESHEAILQVQNGKKNK